LITVSVLWRHRELTVINSTALSNFGRYAMMLDGKLTEADVDYVVSGSVRRWDARIRVDAQLTDVRSGQYIWIDSYDTDPEDLPVMQDRIATMIAAQIEPEIGLSEGNKALRKSPHGLAAWDCYHLGMSHYYKFTPTDNREAERLFSRSLELDPDFGEAHGWWSYAKILSMVYYEEPFSRLTIEQAYRAASRAVEIDGQNPIFHTLLSRVLLADGQYDGALSIMRHAVELNANLPVVYCAMGDALAYQGRPDEAMENFETAIALSSRDPIRWAFFGYGSMALIFAERFEEAAKWAGNAILHPNCQFWAYAHRVAALGHLGKRSEAQGALSELRRKLPGFSRRFAEEKLFFIKRPEQLRLYLDGLSKAGVD
jgi:adenylate cyclase